jgi:26S proteasome regulatory subunit N2
LAQLQDTSRDV